MNEKEKCHPCYNCIECCTYVAAEIGPPTSKMQQDNIVWMLHHDNVIVFTDEDDDWYVQFNTPCSQLSKDGLCKIYKRRPNQCRDYDPEECPTHTGGRGEKLIFRQASSFLAYLTKNNKNRLNKKKKK